MNTTRCIKWWIRGDDRAAVRTHGEALGYWHFDVEQQDSGSETGAGPNGLLGVTEHTADTKGRRTTRITM